jgi:hypothetical protein
MQYKSKKNKIAKMWENSQTVENKTGNVINKITPIWKQDSLSAPQVYESEWQVIEVGGGHTTYLGHGDLVYEDVDYSIFVDLDIEESLLPGIRSNLLFNIPSIVSTEYYYPISELQAGADYTFFLNGIGTYRHCFVKIGVNKYRLYRVGDLYLRLPFNLVGGHMIKETRQIKLKLIVSFSAINKFQEDKKYVI